MEKKAAKKKTDRGTTFAGLLVFDLLGLAAVSLVERFDIQPYSDFSAK